MTRKLDMHRKRKPVFREVLYKGFHNSDGICYVAIIPRTLTTIIKAQHPENRSTSITNLSEDLATKILAGLPELYGKLPDEVQWFETYWLARIGCAKAEGVPITDLFPGMCKVDWVSDPASHLKYEVNKARRLSTVSYSVTWNDEKPTLESPKWASTDPDLQEELLGILASLAARALGA